MITTGPNIQWHSPEIPSQIVAKGTALVNNTLKTSYLFQNILPVTYHHLTAIQTQVSHTTYRTFLLE